MTANYTHVLSKGEMIDMIMKLETQLQERDARIKALKGMLMTSAVTLQTGNEAARMILVRIIRKDLQGKD